MFSGDSGRKKGFPHRQLKNERGNQLRICVIIPAYNESQAIGELIERVRREGLEVIVVDDGSTDGTVKIAQAGGARVLVSGRNMGKGASLIKGYNFALAQGFDAVISMDGDGQHSPDDLAAFVRKARESGAGLIVGNRMGSAKGMPLLRVATNHLMSKLISFIVKQRVPDTQCGYRLAKKELLEKIDLSTSKYETESEILISAARLGVKIESIPVKTIYAGEKSQINPLVDTLRFLRFLGRELIRPQQPGKCLHKENLR
jgi:glycosyltransferase involved in cell wall biosynthesis